MPAKMTLARLWGTSYRVAEFGGKPADIGDVIESSSRAIRSRSRCSEQKLILARRDKPIMLETLGRCRCRSQASEL